MGTEKFDVMVIGAGPAGATAATLLAQGGHRVGLLDRAKFPRGGAFAGWLNGRAAPLLAKLGVPVKPLLDCSFKNVLFYNADLSKQAKPNLSEAPGYLIDRWEFDNALVSTARSEGVEILDGRVVRDMQLKEAGVSILCEDSNRVEGRLLILATGRSGELLDRVGVARDRAHKPVWCAQVDAPLPSAASEPVVAVVLGLDRRGGFGMCCVSRKWFSIAVNLFTERDRASSSLVTLCRTAFEKGLVPNDLSSTAAGAPVFSSPASAGLDMETHVGKHTLVVGDAGGFVSAASNEGLYPAMWSAQLAAEVAAEALESAKKGEPAQDHLMRFDSLWRMKMADYLRTPHTDIQFILPLIFSNQPMADRMAAAFFSGENI